MIRNLMTLHSDTKVHTLSLPAHGFISFTRSAALLRTDSMGRIMGFCQSSVKASNIYLCTLHFAIDTLASVAVFLPAAAMREL